MFGMTISSSQAKTLVDFINAEKANYIEEKVKGDTQPEECYEDL